MAVEIVGQTENKLAFCKQLRGADVLVDALICEGVRKTFGIQGGAAVTLFDALSKRPEIEHVPACHEQNAAHMAEGYGMAGELGVVIVTSGPGATNTVTGVYDAFMDNRALLVITGQVAQRDLGKQAFQEVNITDMLRLVTKGSYQITSLEQIRSVIHDVCLLAKSGRPGPVIVDVPKDVQATLTADNPFSSNGRVHEECLSPEAQAKLGQVANLLNEAKSPLILAGHGVTLSQSEQELLVLAEKSGIPVATTLLGLSSFPSRHDLSVGMAGMHGRKSVNTLIQQEADLVVVAGARLDDRLTGTHAADFARRAKIVQIDIGEKPTNPDVALELFIQANLKPALGKISEGLEKREHTDWIGKFRQIDAVEHAQVFQNVLFPKHPELTMAETIHALSEKTQGNAIIVSSVGQHEMVLAQHYKFKNPRSFFASGGAGTMGVALPAAIGAKEAFPDSLVIAVTGDGSLLMNPQELKTIGDRGENVKILVLDNQSLGMVKQWQRILFESNFAYTLLKRNPDFVKLAEAYGIEAQRVIRRKDLSKALDRMLNSTGPHLLHVLTSEAEGVFPMVAPGSKLDQMQFGWAV